MYSGTYGFRRMVQSVKRAGFTLTEAILVVLFLGIFSAIAIPKLNQAVVSKYKAEAEAKKIVTCLRRVRGLAISSAVTNTDGFALKFLNNPFTSYEIVNLNTAEVVDSYNIDPKVNITGTADQFEFGPLGNLTSTYTQISVSAEGKSYTITIITATGMVKCTES